MDNTQVTNCIHCLQWIALTPTVQAMAPVLVASVTAKQGGRVQTAVLWINRCTSAYLDAQSMAVMIWRPEHVSVIIIGLVQIVHRVCMPLLQTTEHLTHTSLCPLCQDFTCWGSHYSTKIVFCCEYILDVYGREEQVKNSQQLYVFKSFKLQQVISKASLHLSDIHERRLYLHTHCQFFIT